MTEYNKTVQNSINLSGMLVMSRYTETYITTGYNAKQNRTTQNSIGTGKGVKTSWRTKQNKTVYNTTSQNKTVSRLYPCLCTAKNKKE